LPKVQSLDFHEGDTFATVEGVGVDQIRTIKIGDVSLLPSEPQGFDAPGAPKQRFSVQSTPLPFKRGETMRVEFGLKDGRVLTEGATVGAPRPSAKLLSKTIEGNRDRSSVPIEAGDNDLAPLGSKLTVSIQAVAPTRFSKQTRIDISADGGKSYSSVTTHSGLVLEDDQIAVAHLDTGKVFDLSTHGPLLFRISTDGDVGEWRPITNIVRYPTIESYGCDLKSGGTCWIRGENLFLIQSLSSDPAFSDCVAIPPGLTASKIEFPAHGAQKVFLRLRDQPAAMLTLDFR